MAVANAALARLKQALPVLPPALAVTQALLHQGLGFRGADHGVGDTSQRGHQFVVDPDPVLSITPVRFPGGLSFQRLPPLASGRRHPVYHPDSLGDR